MKTPPITRRKASRIKRMPRGINLRGGLGYEEIMFHYISGTLEYIDINFAVLDAGGVGYKLTISQNTHAKISGMRTGNANPKVKLFTYMAVMRTESNFTDLQAPTRI